MTIIPFEPGDSLYFNPDGSIIFQRIDRQPKRVESFSMDGVTLAADDVMTITPSGKAELIDVLDMMRDDKTALAARYGEDAPVVKTLEGYGMILDRVIREATVSE